MHTLTVLAALSASAFAQLLTPAQLASIPVPQVESVPIGASSQIVTNSTKRALYARDTPACSPRPAGSGPVPSPDTDSNFLADSDFSNAALQAITPAGWLQTYQNKQSATTASAYLGYKSYTSYSPSQCAADCNALTGCMSFNIYFERDPSIEPGAACPNPPSTTVIKCSYWGLPIGPATLTNPGQYMNDFHVVIAGSNGYQIAQPAGNVPGYNGTFTGGATINAPTDCNSYITYVAHSDQPYDPNLCAADCANERSNSGPFQGAQCRFFTSYLLVKNGLVQSQICALYTRTWDSSYATNTGYTYNSDVYTIEDAYSFTYSSDIGTFVCPQGSSSSSSSSSTTSSSTMSSSVKSSSTSSSSSASSAPVLSSSQTSTRSTTTGFVTSTRSVSSSQTSTKATTVSTTPATSLKSSSTSKSSASSAPTSAPSLTSCPQSLGYIIAKDTRSLYSNCLDTDYQIPSPQIYYGVPDNRYCAEKCDQTSGCTKAVYKLDTQTCYLKGSPSVADSNWRSNSGFQTLVKIPDNTPLTSCLAPLYSIVQNGVTWTVCPSSDAGFPAVDIWYNVPDEYTCAAKCQSSSKCSLFVYNFFTQTCYNNGDATLADTNWTVQTGFATYFK